ncbi:hypothetical protein ERICIV_02480 [Paenibacillus larvae subsp. larvae]|uniref:DUF1640 domain-containing protein n=2 Tax=Paenibacillus larvae TaxID=1464 RepID=A0A6C0QUG1_9BACL|nr:hypothetical protein [Paenibacillus larvae]QHZ54133.1 hypothetical protein ERICV_05149 [Paenibacillus phage phiERICV]AQT83475.1 hypothetical protein B1222_01925 [Paenibacillus larvae subsp. pulvifaciens]AQZ48576.1 hypothetical protein B5S25_20360 [Paenibacillus larvae subsp. pulvifaciens]ARF70104.1 hypothetical protein B7C51_23040 [Paenibacillus larvae subsp. pulvifaciens]AVF31388.1 hypothetical protein ERICIV_02480 [Paenibacillus larvae subsp. larvae]
MNNEIKKEDVVVQIESYLKKKGKQELQCLPFENVDVISDYIDFTYNTSRNTDVDKILEIFKSTRAQTSSTGEVGPMDELNKSLLERMERDIREHRQEVANRDSRLQAEMQEREKRIREDNKEREERIFKVLDTISSEVKQIRKDLHGEMKEMKSELNNEVRHIRNEISDNTKHVQSLVRQNQWGYITAVLAVLAICATISFTVWAALIK